MSDSETTPLLKEVTLTDSSLITVEESEKTETENEPNQTMILLKENLFRFWILLFCLLPFLIFGLKAIYTTIANWLFTLLTFWGVIVWFWYYPIVENEFPYPKRDCVGHNTVNNEKDDEEELENKTNLIQPKHVILIKHQKETRDIVKHTFQSIEEASNTK